MTSFALELPQHDRGGRLKKKEKIEGVVLKMEGNYGRELFNFKPSVMGVLSLNGEDDSGVSEQFTPGMSYL